MQKADNAVQPRAQLNTLPDELQAYIARLCAEQDVAVRKALADCHERFQEFRPPASDVYAYLSQVKCSVGALYGTSKGWQKVAAPYRFQLRDERFRLDYAHRFGHFFVALDLTPAPATGDYIHLAGVNSLLPNLVRIKVGNYEETLKVPRNRDLYGHSHTAYAIETAKAAVVRLLNMAVDVSVVVTTLDQIPRHLSSVALDRLRRLSVEVTTASFRNLIPLLLKTPNLETLELCLKGHADQTDAVEYPDISGAVLALAELFAPTLRNLELRFKEYSQFFSVAKPKESTGFVEEFSALTDLTLSGSIDALRGPLASISDHLFPALTHLRYLPDSVAPYVARRPGEPKIKKLVRKKPIERISVYNLVGPVDKNGPELSLPARSRVTRPPLYPSLVAHVAEPAASDLPSRKRDLRNTLQFLLEWEARADAQGDTASLLRMASALTRVELERIAHEA
ncbi:hypothetical protein JCM8115_001213 [Rhodotorula mucilaginosa]